MRKTLIFAIVLVGFFSATFAAPATGANSGSTGNKNLPIVDASTTTMSTNITASTSASMSPSPTSTDVPRTADHNSTDEAATKTTPSPSTDVTHQSGRPNLEVLVEEAQADKSAEKAAWNAIASLIFGIYVI
ncbi:hypothetical protein L596_010124 [Steinernema carpocapsae]|uniref:Uncharacterized protein n=1 Tax=Steinernema carpocapsae TaxID=34508 RepID=A0A4U5PHE3_STECR|nr:hypothetical protein L596_010124 [Steinernema carpocapsae]